jgi:hypothetical protein
VPFPQWGSWVDPFSLLVIFEHLCLCPCSRAGRCPASKWLSVYLRSPPGSPPHHPLLTKHCRFSLL